MGCECQQSQTRGLSIGVFVSSRVSSPLTPRQKPLLRLETQLGRSVLPIRPPWGLTHPLLSPPCCGVTPLMLCRSLPCSGCSVAVSVLLQPAPAPPHLKAHQQICLVFFQHTSLCVCKPHSGSPNLGVCFPICMPGREEETPPSPNPAWAVLLLSSNPPRLIQELA